MTSYSLSDLARHSGLKPRTIRSYIEKGLLAGPDSMGPKARYDESHLQRLRAIVALKSQSGLSLESIRGLLVSLSPEALAQLAEQATSLRPMSNRSARSRADSALDYLREISPGLLGEPTSRDVRSGVRKPAARPAGHSPASVAGSDAASGTRPDVPPGPIEQLRERLEQVTGPPTTHRHRRPRSQGWQRVPITRDLELHVRSSLPPDEIHRIEEIADLLRAFLLGR
jgi:DNA-binding transcriptional MerR regulator